MYHQHHGRSYHQRSVVEITPQPDWASMDVISMASSWPSSHPMALIHSGGTSGPWARWSILAAPRGHLRIDSNGYSWNGISWPELEAALEAVDSNDPMAIIDAAMNCGMQNSSSPAIPFIGGWILSLRYELGGVVEPTALTADGTLADLLWCPDALVHDAQESQWWRVGNPPHPDTSLEPHQSLQISGWTTSPDRSGFEESVSRTIELIQQGDLFQANIARQLAARCQGDLRQFALEALASSGAWFGCWIELLSNSAATGQLSLSPELFLDVDSRTRQVRTRPIKGTLPSGASAEELASSEKDAAELNMIVDLMRNDLGRVCTLGSVEVSQLRMIETHPTVHHGVAEIKGQLKANTSTGDLLRACFPPGSVTGAPKVRAMQVIDELEDSPRGMYCGALGFQSACGDLRLGVSIRNVAFQGQAHDGFRNVDGQLTYGTGCGIVADSIPSLEWEESQHKAEALMRLTRTTSCT